MREGGGPAQSPSRQHLVRFFGEPRLCVVVSPPDNSTLVETQMPIQRHSSVLHVLGFGNSDFEGCFPCMYSADSEYLVKYEPKSKDISVLPALSQAFNMLGPTLDVWKAAMDQHVWLTFPAALLDNMSCYKIQLNTFPLNSFRMGTFKLRFLWS